MTLPRPFLLLALLLLAPIDAGAALDPQDPRRAGAQEAIARAQHWFDALDVEPVLLQTLGVPGKKAMAEILDAYALYLSIARDRADSTRVLQKVLRLAEETERSEYHDLGELDDASFDANIMSYLRVLFLLRELELNPSRYEMHARALLPRIESRLAGRGPWQRAMFAHYYELFEWDTPEVLREATMAGGFLDLKPAVSTFDQGERASNHVDSYALVHELLVAFDYGRRLEPDGVDEGDRTYLLSALPELILRYVPENNADLVAELVMCMGFLGWTAHPAADLGLDYLLDAQNPNGSWGDYEQFRVNWREFLEHRAYLHTTLVAVWALTTACDEDRPSKPMSIDSATILNVAGFHQARGNPEMAHRVLDKHLAVDPAVFHGALARIDLQLGELDRGQEHLQSALATSPDDDSLRILEALYHRERRDWKAAADAFGRITDAASLGAADWFLCGDVLYRSGNAQAAVQAFGHCLALDERHHAASNYCAWILATDLGAPEQALAHAQRAITLAPDEPEYHDTYLEALERSGRDDEARSHLQKIRARFPSNGSLAERAKRYGL